MNVLIYVFHWLYPFQLSASWIFNILHVIVCDCRYEIQYHEPVNNYTSNEKAKYFFDNMTEYLDSLLLIQTEVAHRISEEVDVVLAQVVFKVIAHSHAVGLLRTFNSSYVAKQYLLNMIFARIKVFLMFI